jgi:WD40 repeat protein
VLLALVVWLLHTAASMAGTFNAATVSVSPDGTRVYSGFNGRGFSVFTRDPTTGDLTVLGEASGTPGGGGLFQPAIAVSPDSASVYGVDGMSNQLLQYGSGAGGVVQQETYPVLADPTAAKDPITLTASPDGVSIYVVTYGVQFGTGIGVSSDGKVNAFHRDPTTGNLTLVGTTPLGSGGHAGEVGTVPVLSGDGKFFYVADTFGVAVLSRDLSTGALTFVGDDGGVSSGGVNGAIAIAISPDGNFIYGAGPPSQNSAASSAISVLSRNATTGRLTPVSQVENGLGGVSGLSDIWGLAVSPDGQCVYAASRAEGSLAYFTRNTMTGALTFGGVGTEGNGGVTGLANAREVSVSPDGKDVYVASANDDGVAVFTRNAMTCAPSFVELVQDLFELGQPAVNQSQGTATLPVTADTAGTIAFSVQPLGGASRAAHRAQLVQVTGPGMVNVPIAVTGQAAEELDRLHKLNVKATVTFTASGGTPTTKATVLQLVKTPPSATTIRKALLKALVPSGRKARIRAMLRNRGYRSPFNAPDAGQLVIGWYLVPGGALLARASVTFSTAQTAVVKISLTTRGHQLLNGASRLRVTGKASFKLLDGQLVTVKRRFRLRR